MEVSAETRRKVLLIKEMIGKGYKDKHICMVMQENQPYVNRIRSGKIHKNTFIGREESVEMTEREKSRLNALNTILKMPEIPGRGFTEQDEIYIRVLKFFLIEKEEVYNLYFHLTKKQFYGTWVRKGIDLRKFISERIGVSYEDYIDLIIDYLIK